ncbi:type II toxin-antitoxin system YafQ family toxin [Campylobacter sp. MIT 12-5580]|uniref:type II toxin-antitoxin system YafQ family toxin n=1 Tax=Campylobacter sp. MIT 12-5580 TaxID=2040651 RepID=UPI0010F953FB|nr:type II toxin-antitoxin system YafQ family toxin [Campylobacter sp. MIT 12-5580]TKX30199.1 type II toxin-antitoxin system YafQ family toxin [Campylobacter sp. MIT 12-5580]
MYKLETTHKFDKQYKKLSQKDKKLSLELIEKLLSGAVLEPKYKDHHLKGKYKDYKECHIRPDLLLIYQKQNTILVLTCISIGSHSKLF